MAKKRKDSDSTGDRPGNGNVYALLVGINQYTNIHPPLRGCIKDLDRIEAFLKRFWHVESGPSVEPLPFPYEVWKIPTELGYDELRILRLENEQATYANIIQAFREFFTLAGKKDCVWFHYSGHGSEAPTALEFADLVKGLDQGLMCTDYAINLNAGDSAEGRYSGFLADKELRVLLAELTDPTKAIGTPEVLVTLDSCHSGGGSRNPNFPRVRTVAVDEAAKARPLSSYYLGRWAEPISSGQLKLPDPPHTILTACDNHELAAEGNGGLFTTSLINILENVTGPGIISYAELLIRLRGAVRKHNNKQTPQLEALGGRRAYRSFLQGFAQGDPDLYEVSFKGGKWVVALGAIHGLPITAQIQRLATARSQDLELEIYPLGTVIGGGNKGPGGGSNQPTSDGGSGGPLGPVENWGTNLSTLEFRRSNFGIKLHLADFLPGSNNQSMAGALIRRVSEQYSAIEFRQADFGIMVEIYADEGQPSRGPVGIQNTPLQEETRGGESPTVVSELTPPEPAAVTKPLGVAPILEVGPFYSTIDLPAPIRQRGDTVYYALLNYLPVQPVTVLVRGAEEAVESLIAAQADFAKLGARNIRLLAAADPLVKHELEIIIEGEQVRIEDMYQGRRVDREYEKSDPNRIFSDLTQIVNWRRMIALENTDTASRLKDQVSFTLEIGNDQEREAQTVDQGVITYLAEEEKTAPVLNQVDGQRYYRFDLKLNTDESIQEELHYYVFLLDTSYRIHGEPDQKQTGGGELLYSEMALWGLDPDEDKSDLYLKILVTSQPIDAFQFEQPGIGVDRGELMPPEMKLDTGFQDWQMLTAKVAMRRAGADVGGVRGGGSEGGGEGEGGGDDPNVIVHTLPTLKNWTRRPEAFRRSHAFVIGINQYPKLGANLQTAVSDAEQVALRLKLLQRFDHVLLMTDVSKAQIEALLEWLRELRQRAPEIANEEFSTGASTYSSRIAWLKRADEFAPDEDTSGLPTLELTVDNGSAGSRTEQAFLQDATDTAIELGDGPIIQADDSLVFYYAGHGFEGEVADGPTGYLAPTDAEDSRVDDGSLLSMDQLYTALSDAKREEAPSATKRTYECKHTLLILDCCFAGQFRFSRQRSVLQPYLLPLNQGRYNKYVRRNAWQVLASAGPEETAADSASYADVRDKSPFAKTLIAALEGQADLKGPRNRGKRQGDGVITATEIYIYVRDGVDALVGGVQPQHPGLFPMLQHRHGEFLFINPRVSPDSLLNLPPDPEINPYQGLQPYSFADGGRFFGRDTVVDALLERLQQTPILFITGPSGSGKSSLVRAGLFPRLDGVSEWRVVRPSDLTIETHRIEGGETDEISTTEEETPVSYVLLFDQYEEFFSLPDRAGTLAEIDRLFQQAVEDEQRVIFTLRSDFEWQVKATDLRAYWRREHIFRVPPMELDHLREAVTGPAWWANYDFKDTDAFDELDTGNELIGEILADVVNAPGALPLLSFTMQKFFQLAKDEDRGHRLLLSDYETLRGVEGVISLEADALYGTVGPQKLREMNQKQRMFRQVLLRMINIYDGAFTRRRVYHFAEENEERSNAQPFYDELRFPEQDELLDQIVRKLIAANLIVTGVDTQIGVAYLEPAHDALINEWDRCRAWLDQFGKVSLLLQRRLWEAVLEIEMKKLRTLTPVSNSGELFSLQGSASSQQAATSDYWELSPRLDEVTKAILDPHERWLHRLPEGEEILEDLAPLVWDEELSPEQLERLLSNDRQQVQDHTLVSQILGLTEADNGVVKAINLPEGTTIEQVDLLQAITLEMDNWLNDAEKDFVRESWQRRVKRIKELKDALNEAQAGELAAKATTSRNRKTAFRLAELSEAMVNGNLNAKEQLIRYYHLAKEPPHYTLNDHGSNIGGLVFSDDGLRLASSGADHKIRVYDPATGKATAVIPAHSAYIHDLCFWPNRRTRLVSASDDGTVKIWEKKSSGNWQELQSSAARDQGVRSLAISPSAQYLVGGHQDGVIILWSVSQLGIGTNGGVLDQVELGSGNERGKITALNFSPNSNRIVAGNNNGEVQVWKIENDQLVEEVAFTEHSNMEIYEAWFIDDDYVISGARDRKLWRWKIGDGITEEHELLAQEADDYYLRSSCLSPDQQYLVLATSIVCVHRFDRERKAKGAVVHELEVDAIEAKRLVVSRNNSCLAAATGDSVNIWNLNYLSANPPLSSNDQYMLAQGKHFYTAGQRRNLAHSSDDRFRIEAHRNQLTQIQLHDLTKGTNSLLDNENAVQVLRYSADNEVFISGDEQGIIRLWSVNENTPLLQFDTLHDSGRIRGITNLTISADLRWLFCTRYESEHIQLWDLKEEEEPRLAQILQVTRTEGLNGVEFSPDGSRILVAGRHRLKVYRFNSEEGEIAGIPDLVIPEGQNNAHFSPDGQLIITYNFPTYVKVWDAETGVLRMSFPELRKACWGKITADGQWLVIADGGGPCRALWFDSTALLAAANEDRWMGPLNAHEINLYQVERFMDKAGYLDSSGNPTALLEQSNEAVLINYARYFEYMAGQVEDPAEILACLAKARQVYEWAQAIGQIYLLETYTTALEWVDDLTREQRSAKP